MSKTFLIYNNKGGVGKTTLTFTLACEIAEQRKDLNILLIDLDPQCDLSQIVLGGNGNGWDRLESIRKNDLLTRKTICGYFEQRIGSLFQETNTETEYALQCSKYNSNMPENLYIVCGDEDLSMSAESIDKQSQVAPENTTRNTWEAVHKWLHQLIYAIKEKKLGLKNTVVFIDAEPAFSMYTKMGLFASNHIVIPCVADYGSARGVRSIYNHLYKKSPNNLFEERVERWKIKIPSKNDVSIVFNRYTPYRQTPSTTFAAMNALIGDTFERSFNARISDIQKIPDYHKIALLASYHGKPLHQFVNNFEDVYDPDEDKKVQIDKEQVKKYRESINALSEHILKMV